MQLANYHAHSHFSDGQGAPEEYIQSAIAQNLKAYGFSDHAPIPGFSESLMRVDRLDDYLGEIDRIRKAYGDQIQVYKSLEVDYIPGKIGIDSPHIQGAGLDYTIGAVHYVDHFQDGTPWGFESSVEQFEKGLNEIFAGNIRLCLERYFELIREMVVTNQPDIVAHLDRIKKLNSGNKYWSEQESWYKDEVIETLQVIKANQSILEVNTSGYFRGIIEDNYPGKWVLTIAHEMEIPVVLSSDVHHPDNITSGFENAAKILKEVGYSTTRIFLDHQWQDIPIPNYRELRSRQTMNS